MPGAAVHIPLLAAFALIGFFLCWPHPVLRLLLIVWVLAGLYLGRDIAIFCHYVPLLTLVVWVAFAAVLLKASSISKFGVSHFVMPAVLSVAVGAGLTFVALAHVRGASADD